MFPGDIAGLIYIINLIYRKIKHEKKGPSTTEDISDYI